MVYIIRDSWNSNGYRLYAADGVESNTCVQIDGEINGKVWATVQGCREECKRRFGEYPVDRKLSLAHGWN